MNTRRLFACVCTVLAACSVFAADPSVSKWAPNDQPVISGDGTATIARKPAAGTYATLATDVALPWTDTTGGLIEGSNYLYRVTIGGTDTELAYRHAVRLERTWNDLTKIRPSVRMIGWQGGTGQGCIAIAFDGSTSTYYENNASITVGVDFGAPVAVTVLRAAPRSGQSARLVGKKLYAANQQDFSDQVELGAFPAITNNYSTFAFASPGSYRYYYVSPDVGNVAEMEFYGYGFGVRIADAQVNNVPVVDASLPGPVSVWRNGTLLSSSATLPFADPGASSLLAGNSYRYRVLAADGQDVTATNRHAVRLDRSWSDLTQISPSCSIISSANGVSTAYKVFDNNLGTWMEPGTMVGLDFSTGLSAARIRLQPRSGQATRLEGSVIYAANEPDYSDAVALVTVKTLVVSSLDYRFSGLPYYRYYYVKKGSDTNLAEMEIYGCGEPVTSVVFSVEADMQQGFDARRMVVSAALSQARFNIYRDAQSLTSNVVLPWTDTANLSPGQVCVYKLVMTDDTSLTGTVTYTHSVRLERSWLDNTKLRPLARSLSPVFLNNYNPPEGYLYDGDTSTKYHLTSSDGMDFGVPVTLDRARAFRADYAERLNTTQIFGADNPYFTNETCVAIFSGVQAGYWADALATGAPTCRYYRVVWGAANGGNANYPPAELQFYGRPTPGKLVVISTGTNDCPVLDTWYYGTVDVSRDETVIAHGVTLPWTDADPLLVPGETYHYQASATDDSGASFEADYRHAVLLDRAWEAKNALRPGVSSLLGGWTPLLFDGNPYTKYEFGTSAIAFGEPTTVLRIRYSAATAGLPDRMAKVMLYGANTYTGGQFTDSVCLGQLPYKVTEGRNWMDIAEPGAYKYYWLANETIGNSYIGLGELELYGICAPWFAAHPANDLDQPRLHGAGGMGKVTVFRDSVEVAQDVALPWTDATASFAPNTTHTYMIRLADETELTADYRHWELMERKWTDLSSLGRFKIVGGPEDTAVNLFDGDPATVGAFTNIKARIGIDFGTPARMGAVRILSTIILSDAGMTLYASNDGVGINATELVTVPGSWANGVWVEAVIPEAKRDKYRYYWLAPKDGTTTSWRGTVREVQFFGVKPATQLIFLVK